MFCQSAVLFAAAFIDFLSAPVPALGEVGIADDDHYLLPLVPLHLLFLCYFIVLLIHVITGWLK